MSFETSAEVYARHVGRYGPQLAAAFADAAGIRAGMRALDVGCGPGVLTAELARRLGAERVAAVDPSQSFVAAARDRVPGADVRVGTAEELPAFEAPFDAVLSQLVVNFLAEPERGVLELRAAAAEGGIVAAAVWDYAGEMSMLRAFWDGALELDPDAPDEGTTMRFCKDGELGDLWRRCGLEDVETGSLVVCAGYEDFDDYWSPFPAGVAPSGSYCASLDPVGQKRLRQAVFRRLGEPGGRFELSARAWFVRGRA
jgi:SAM-dependent methyltransferase